ncbi:drug/metabolite exporter YedA [Sphaerisporangium rubeum]|uniref:Drug/metabolite transporter (DMT)-like permease n=1 Tax=Sphaerisporangium rubeum TaxID=321317 RepID=A0A7X0I9J2_9ACTN|nr:EamA family transporter [Sphaerisporangium rubeum]MBB6471119.1 drug/metabolite transporter (DMT)-like permease [Sphaerisporangium rubeum]
MRTNTHDIRVWAALAVVYVIWGSTYLAIMIAIETIPPFISGGMRFVTAALVLGAVVLALKGRRAFRMTRREFLGAALVGVLLLTAGNGMVAVAEQYITSGLAALLVASVPLWLVVFRVLARDRPHLLTVAGVLVGFCGVAGLSLDGGGSGGGVGIVILLAASLSWSVGSFLSGRVPMPKDQFAASSVEMIVGGAGMLVIGLTAGERLHVAEVTAASWLAVAYLVVAGSLVGFTSYTWLLGNAPISLVSTYAYVNPVVAVLLGFVVLHEAVTAQMLAGGLVIIVGVALVVSTERHRKRPEAPPAAEPGAAELSRS